MEPGDLGRNLMILGGALLVIGALVFFSGRILPLGNLPGDIQIRRPGFTLYFPITSAILVSLFLTLVVNLFLRR